MKVKLTLKEFRKLIQKSTTMLKESSKKYLLAEQTVDTWRDFLSALSDRVRESDKPLRNLIEKERDAEKIVLKKAFGQVQKKLKEKELVDKFVSIKAMIDFYEDKPIIKFTIEYGNENKKKEKIVPFVIKIKNRRPVFDFTNVDKKLKEIEDGRLLKASLIALEESTTFEEIDDIDKAIQKQIEHLLTLESELDGYIGNLNLLQIAVLRKLLKEKYKDFS